MSWIRVTSFPKNNHSPLLFRAKFDLNTIAVDDDMHLRIRAMSLDLSSPSHIPLNVRMAEFSEDPQNMDQMKEFIDGILNEAQTEVTNRLDEQNKVIRKHFSCNFWLKCYNFWLTFNANIFFQTENRKNGRGMFEKFSLWCFRKRHFNSFNFLRLLLLLFYI